MSKVTLLLMVIFGLSAMAGNSGRPDQSLYPRAGEKTLTDQASAVHLTIATVGPLLGPPTDRYRVGQQVPVLIGMTNMSSQPMYACVSSDLYQDLPSLTRNGRLVPYSKWQSDVLLESQKNQICQNEDLPEPTLLEPNKLTVVDFLVLVDDKVPTGADSWYEPLRPGVYELSIQRRLGCCDGQMIQSNKISFEVMP